MCTEASLLGAVVARTQIPREQKAKLTLRGPQQNQGSRGSSPYRSGLRAEELKYLDCEAPRLHPPHPVSQAPWSMGGAGDKASCTISNVEPSETRSMSLVETSTGGKGAATLAIRKLGEDTVHGPALQTAPGHGFSCVSVNPALTGRTGGKGSPQFASCDFYTCLHLHRCTHTHIIWWHVPSIPCSPSGRVGITLQRGGFTSDPLRTPGLAPPNISAAFLHGVLETVRAVTMERLSLNNPPQYAWPRNVAQPLCGSQLLS